MTVKELDDEPAIRAAMAALSILASVGTSKDPAVSTLPVSIALTSGLSLRGVVQTHVLRFHAVVSDAISRAMVIEAQNEDLKTCILADRTTTHKIGDFAAMRPVVYDKASKESVYELVAETPDKSCPDFASALRVFEKHRDRVLHWERVWEKFEDAIEHSVPDKLESVLKELEAYRAYTEVWANDMMSAAAAGGGGGATADHLTAYYQSFIVHDVPFQRTMATVRTLLLDLGVDLFDLAQPNRAPL